MTSTTAHIAPTRTKHSWTFFELLALAPFGVLLWYVATQPLVLHKEVPNSAPVAEAPATAPAAAPDPDAPVFVVGGKSTVVQRIAPVARVTVEGGEPAAAPAAEPVAATPPVAAAVQAVPVAVPPAAPALQPLGQPATPAQQAASKARIAITDGTGVDGLAKDIAAAMEQAGMAVAKTANMAAGSQRRTVIFYRDGFEEEARRLSQVFAQPPAMVKRDGADDSDVRLVLGSAAARDKALLARKGG